MSKYKTINGWTKARMIKAIWDGNNGSPAMDGSFTCLYRDNTGNKCAVGCFIPEGHESQEFNGPVGYLLDEHADLRYLMPLSEEALVDLQVQHDCLATQESYADVRVMLEAWINTYVQDAVA